jgi:cytochrome c-type biogenesis protein CcmH/NrfF
MIQSRRLWVLALLVLAVALIVTAVVLWQRGREYEGVSVAPETSPLPGPTAAEVSSSPPSLSSLATALFWVVLGGLLALGVAFLILRQHKSTR